MLIKFGTNSVYKLGRPLLCDNVILRLGHALILTSITGGGGEFQHFTRATIPHFHAWTQLTASAHQSFPQRVAAAGPDDSSAIRNRFAIIRVTRLREKKKCCDLDLATAVGNCTGDYLWSLDYDDLGWKTVLQPLSWGEIGDGQSV